MCINLRINVNLENYVPPLNVIPDDMKRSWGTLRRGIKAPFTQIIAKHGTIGEELVWRLYAKMDDLAGGKDTPVCLAGSIVLSQNMSELQTLSD